MHIGMQNPKGRPDINFGTSTGCRGMLSLPFNLLNSPSSIDADLKFDAIYYKLLPVWWRLYH